MKLNKWTVGLMAVGAVSFGSVAQADESEMSVIQSATSGVTIGGYVSTSFRYDANTATAAAGNWNSADPIGVGKGNGFNLDVVNVTIEKPLDEGEWAAGYKAELLYGSAADIAAIVQENEQDHGERRAAGDEVVPRGRILDQPADRVDRCGFRVRFHFFVWRRLFFHAHRRLRIPRIRSSRSSTTCTGSPSFTRTTTAPTCPKRRRNFRNES